MTKLKQRSPEWHAFRASSTGGSEIAKILNNACDNSAKDILQKKVNSHNLVLEPIVSEAVKIMMDWGVLFEPVHSKILESLLEIEILEASCMKGKDTLDSFHHSPDGLAVVSSEKLLTHCYIDNNWKNKAIFHEPYQTIVIEQKAPARRVVNLGYMPSNYIDQVKLGI